MSTLCKAKRSDGSYVFNVYLNDELVIKIINNDARVFHDVKVYTSDNFYQAAKANLRNLLITTDTGKHK